MLTRTLDGGVPAQWLTGDEVYGQHPGLRAFAAQRGLSYVLAVPSNQWVWTTGPQGPVQAHAKTVADRIAAQAFRSVEVGPGAKGPRLYRWARVELHPAPGDGTRSWLLVRRSTSDPTERAFYLARAPRETSTADLARVAGVRWAIEETFQTAKGEWS